MASIQLVSLTEEISCPICLDFFTDPVILECGHNFCRSCLTQCWEREERNSCPECREEFADRTLRVNRALANLSEKARKLNLNPKEKESKLHCEEHEEELKLFCETDKTLICVICRDAQEHRDHRFLPIKEAVKMYKAQIESSIESLAKRTPVIQEMEQRQRQKISEFREEACRKSRISEKCVLPEAVDVLQIAKFDHPFLLHAALREMLDAIKQDSVTLDMETVGPWLEVSEDQKSVRWTQNCISPPDTGKRPVRVHIAEFWS
ncbi:nuclear factor 7, brain-like isoform X2 [Mobula hypostoma]|uniref:nuclear factor 7, brain-like isoform X2 n=1 Tax=Mobula hypostoma TaxID=723540 RepID=UPI002FC350E1